MRILMLLIWITFVVGVEAVHSKDSLWQLQLETLRPLLRLPAQQSRTIEGFAVGGTFNPRTGKLEGGKKTEPITFSADQESARFLDKWLTNNCQ